MEARPHHTGIDGNCAGGFSATPPTLFFCADALVTGQVRLFRAPLDFVTEPANITGTALTATDVIEVRVDPTGTFVAFRADKEVDQQVSLYRVRADGTGTAQRIHATPIPAGADIPGPGDFDFTPDGFGIFCVADQDVDEKFELFLSDGMVFRANFEWGATNEWSSVAP